MEIISQTNRLTEGNALRNAVLEESLTGKTSLFLTLCSEILKSNMQLIPESELEKQQLPQRPSSQ